MPKKKQAVQAPVQEPVQEPAQEQIEEQIEATVQALTKVLDKCMPYAEKRRLMTLEVLREECGRELSSAARANNKEFSWSEFNAQFREDYQNATLKDLVSYCSSLYGLRTWDEICERRSSHKQLRAKRTAASKIDDDDMDDDDIDLD